ncbi:aryl-sulfate sulfotransferase [Thermophilibacter sp.]
MRNKIDYSFKESLAARQARSEERFLTELDTGRNRIDDPLVLVNPYLINPLSALVGFYTDDEVAITLTVRGIEPEGDITHTFPPARRHVLPVLGLYSDRTNVVEIAPYEGASHTIEVRTEALTDAPSLVSMKTTHAYLGDNMIFVTPSLAALATGFDYRGDIRWHLNEPLVFDMKRLRNGNVLIGTERVIEMPYYMTGLYEMTMAGKIVREYSIPGGYHHDQWEMDDGNLLVLTENPTFETVEDQVVLLDRQTGKELRRWDLKDCLTPGEGKSGSWSEKDWFHNNALWYDANDNAIVLSGRHTDCIVSIDYDTGELKWILGDPRTWPEDKQRYLFKRVGGGDFDWFYEQHGCLVTPQGDVMCFDNGRFRSKIREEFLLNKDNFSRGVRYRLNRDDMTVEQTWQYGKELGEDFYSSYIGNVEYYGEGHYMVHSGGIQYYGEHASETPAALMQNDPNVRAESETVEIADGEVVLDLRITGNFYRAEKLGLYHDQDNAPLGPAVRLGSIGRTSEFGTIVPAPRTGELLPERYEASLEEEDDRFTFNAIFESGQLVMLMLEQGAERHGYFISTAKNKFNALCCGTFIKNDPRSVSLSVSKEGLSGTYDVCVTVDDTEFETGVTITC